MEPKRIPRGLWQRAKPRYRAAFVIGVIVSVWLGIGFVQGGKTQNAESVAEQPEAAVTKPRVRVRTLAAAERSATVRVRGRTEALRKVEIRAEIVGVVEKIHFEKGDTVKAGDPLCQLEVDAREAELEQAKALVRQRALEYEAARKLGQTGFRSETQKAGALAAYESAKADLKRLEVALEDTVIRAPFDGIIDSRAVEVGDYMRPGDICALVMAAEPFLAVGRVTETQVNQITPGSRATARLITGETVEGRIRFVAKRADPATRTFQIEVEIPNPDASLREGVTTDIEIPVRTVRAHAISPAILVLDDTGVVGVRTVENGKVRFRKVTIVADGQDGTWVTGLPEHVTVITVGQQYVTEGQEVEAVEERAEARS